MICKSMFAQFEIGLRNLDENIAWNEIRDNPFEQHLIFNR